MSNRVLRGWKQISEYMQYSVSTLKAWNKKDGFPVLRATDKDRKTVVTTTRLIDIWLTHKLEEQEENKKS